MSDTIKTYNKRAMTITEASQYVGVSRGTIENWLKKGLLPFEELPGKGNGFHKFRLIRKEDIDKFLDSTYHDRGIYPKTDKEKNNDIFLLPKSLGKN